MVVVERGEGLMEVAVGRGVGGGGIAVPENVSG